MAAAQIYGACAAQPAAQLLAAWRRWSDLVLLLMSRAEHIYEQTVVCSRLRTEQLQAGCAQHEDPAPPGGLSLTLALFLGPC